MKKSQKSSGITLSLSFKEKSGSNSTEPMSKEVNTPNYFAHTNHTLKYVVEKES